MSKIKNKITYALANIKVGAFVPIDDNCCLFANNNDCCYVRFIKNSNRAVTIRIFDKEYDCECNRSNKKVADIKVYETLIFNRIKTKVSTAYILENDLAGTIAKRLRKIH